MEIRSTNLFCSAKNEKTLNSGKANLSFGTKVETSIPVKNKIVQLCNGDEKPYWEFLRNLLSKDKSPNPGSNDTVSLSLVKRDGIPAIKARYNGDESLITDPTGHYNVNKLNLADIIRGITKISGNI